LGSQESPDERSFAHGLRHLMVVTVDQHVSLQDREPIDLDLDLEDPATKRHSVDIHAEQQPITVPEVGLGNVALAEIGKESASSKAAMEASSPCLLSIGMSTRTAQGLHENSRQDDPAWYWPNRLSSSPSHL
jgi:hypothetical protein